ncbi:MAG: hypothetical protein ACLFP8_01290 [Alphaproteobacteria bacterium]
MIEAVNSTIANATTVRGMVGQVDSASVSSVTAVLPASGSEAMPGAPQAPFVSPFISVDMNYNTPVLQIRDAQTGDVKQQFPTEARLTKVAATQAELFGSLQETASTTYVSTGTTVPQETMGSGEGQGQIALQAVDVTTVQDVTSNAASSTPQIAVAALSAAAHSPAPTAAGAPELSGGVTVYA